MKTSTALSLERMTKNTKASGEINTALSSERMMKWFRYEHLTNEKMRSVSSRFHALAVEVVTCIKPGPERTVALRKLLEAKDAAVRAVIEESEINEVKK